MKCRVIFNGKEYEADRGVNTGDFLSALGFELICGGAGKCGKCRILCSGGLSEPSATEKELLGEELIKSGVRLACRTYITGDCVINTEGKGYAVVKGDGILPEFSLCPSFKKYGVAVDIGTTTVAARLYGVDGSLLSSSSGMNPQRRYGGDVVSRMEAALDGKGGELASVIREYVSELIKKAASDAGVSTDGIDGAVITGNTVMLSFLTKTDTEPLTHAPFETSRLFGETVSAGDIGLTALPKETGVYLPRCVSAFVGADIVTALTAARIEKTDKTVVLTDIGTNGEIVLKNNNGTFACSTAAGPAFEGAGISAGMSGSSGAIDRVWVENGKIKARVIGGGEPAGICGSGIVDAVAALLDTELLDETGFMEDGDAVILPPVTLTQKDIRAVQLAKSAIHAGIITLLKTAGVGCGDVDTLYIAGGFGSYLDVSNAAKIGLIPAELEKKVKVIGNAALSGASALLLSEPLKQSSDCYAKSIKTVNLAANPLFVSEYTEKMMF